MIINANLSIIFFQEQTDQQQQRYVQGLGEICNLAQGQRSFENQHHPLMIKATSTQFYNLCKIADNYRRCKLEKRKMTADIFKLDIKKEIMPILAHIGETAFKGQSKMKAAEVIYSWVFNRCECALLW